MVKMGGPDLTVASLNSASDPPRITGGMGRFRSDLGRAHAGTASAAAQSTVEAAPSAPRTVGSGWLAKARTRTMAARASRTTCGAAARSTMGSGFSGSWT